MDFKEHWERTYQTKRPTQVRWYRADLEICLR